MVPAGKPVDAVLENITPLLNKGDIVVDAGNSYFKDTERRIADLASKGLHFMGMGVSGGEKGPEPVQALCLVEIWKPSIF
jgi:6-phosphogluconate dehydrogenase